MYYSSFSRKIEEKLYIKHCSISTFMSLSNIHLWTDMDLHQGITWPFLLFMDMDVHNLSIIEYFTAF